tara:strand:- start:2188 stop:3393 length:1206 start_codon:yes stop_codon:yes gene_type:complete
MREVLIKEYNNLKRLNLKSKGGDYTFKLDFLQGCTFEILGTKPGKFNVQFLNQDNNEIVYESQITNNMWVKSNKKYYLNYLIKVTDLENNKVIFEHKFNAEDKRVYIHLDSKAIGDTLAWFPYVEEFRKKHKCQMVCSTFHNEWFESNYPKIEFITPGTQSPNLYAMYNIGWHYNEDNTVNADWNPNDFKKYSLQECSADILGVDYNEIKPKLTFKNEGSKIEGKYVCIAPHGSAHAKYWNNPKGWQHVIDYLNENGYKVLMITQEKLGDKWHDSKLGGTLTGVIDKTGDYPLSDRANDIINAEFFIGIGSGLSWLSWALNTKTILISGFSAPFSEFKDCERIFPPLSSCNSCYNKVRLNAGDWEWCPEHKNTKSQYECTKTITSTTVIEAIERIKNLTYL